MIDIDAIRKRNEARSADPNYRYQHGHAGTHGSESCGISGLHHHHDDRCDPSPYADIDALLAEVDSLRSQVNRAVPMIAGAVLVAEDMIGDAQRIWLELCRACPTSVDEFDEAKDVADKIIAERNAFGMDDVSGAYLTVVCALCRKSIILNDPDLERVVNSPVYCARQECIDSVAARVLSKSPFGTQLT